MALTRAQRLALMLLAHHYFAQLEEPEEKKGNDDRVLKENRLFKQLYSVRWAREVERKEAKKDFDNFMRVATPKASEYIYEQLHEVMANETYWRHAPDFVRPLITEAFGYAPSQGKKEKLPQSSPDQVLENLLKDDKPYLRKLGNKYSGIWDVVRYSAHGDPHVEHVPKNPRVMRAAMQIFEPAFEEDLPRFLIHYRPGGPAETIRISRGSVLSLGRGTHMQFVGWEAPRRFPLNIVAEQELDDDHRPPVFFGLVTRFHERNFFFASRVLFVRSKVKSIDELKGHVNMHTMDELRKQFEEDHPSLQFDQLMKQIENKVGAGGTSGLHLVV